MPNLSQPNPGPRPEWSPCSYWCFVTTNTGKSQKSDARSHWIKCNPKESILDINDWQKCKKLLESECKIGSCEKQSKAGRPACVQAWRHRMRKKSPRHERRFHNVSINRESRIIAGRMIRPPVACDPIWQGKGVTCATSGYNESGPFFFFKVLLLEF